MECYKPHIFFWAEDGDCSLGEGLWPGRSQIRYVNLSLGIGTEDACTVPPILFIISSGVQLLY